MWHVLHWMVSCRQGDCNNVVCFVRCTYVVLLMSGWYI